MKSKRRRVCLKKSGIEKFIQNYLKGYKSAKKKSGYELWLRENGVDPTATLTEEIENIAAENERKNSLDSSRAASLSSLGLKSSGYARFLDEISKETSEDKISGAIRSYLSSDKQNENEYDLELKRREKARLAEEKKAEAERLKKQKEEEKLIKAKEKEEEEKRKESEKAMKEVYKKVKEGLNAAAFADYDKAYTYAIEMGLNEADAKYLAKTSTESVRNSRITKVTNAIISKGLSMNQAKQYALALGLSEEDATALAEFAFTTNESVTDIVGQDNFLDYLREQANKSKK